MSTTPEGVAPKPDVTVSPQRRWTEAERLAALRRYRILDTPAEKSFDDITRIASIVCNTPMALVSFVDADRQWFKSERGFGVRETTLGDSVCKTAMLEPGIFVVPDLSADERFRGGNLIAGDPHLRFYASARLETPEGLPLGTVCVLDDKPRPDGLTEEQLDVLGALARQAMLQLELADRERELEHRRASLFKLVAKAPIGIVQTDLDGKIEFINDEYAELIGRPAATLAGERLTDFVHEHDLVPHARAVKHALTGETSVALEKRFVRPDGSEIWASDHLSATRDADDNLVSIVAVARDITERLKITSALAASERKFRAIADAMPQMVWSTLPDGFHDYYNQRWYDFTGVAEGSTDGEGWNGMFHPDDQERAWEKWRHCLKTGDPYDIEYRLRHRSGEYRWVLGRALAIRNASGEIERWFGTCTDIEDIKRSEEARELLAQELSHRIKNVFAVIGGLVSLTARGNPQSQAFAAGFRERLNALSLANEYVRPHAETVGLTDGQTVQGLLRTLLKPYLDAEGGRFIFDGSDAAIGPKTATALALVMHEQATNAMKYGALSNQTGHVYITGETSGGMYAVTWREDGGPVVAGPPGRRGFGTDMAARSAAGQLGGRIEHRWEPSGLVVVLTVPHDNLMR